MPKAIMYFPAGFLWGSATAAYCVEGASPASDWSEWGQQPEGVLDESKPDGLANGGRGAGARILTAHRRLIRRPCGFPWNGRACSLSRTAGMNPRWTAIVRC